jgi:quercetin dioxygenase-like cupin family protein
METAKDGNLVAVDANGIPWAEVFNDKIGRAVFRKELFTDPETGVSICLVRYPAGVISPLHTHPCGHGMYVLEGNLVTHQGTFGPGTFVWFPEGAVMEHGASAAGDVTVLFVTNKAFRIDYVNEPSI